MKAREHKTIDRFNTREEIEKWDVCPAAGDFTPGENFRTIVLRHKIPRKPLTPMNQVNNNQ